MSSSRAARVWYGAVAWTPRTHEDEGSPPQATERPRAASAALRFRAGGIGRDAAGGALLAFVIALTAFFLATIS